MSPAYLPGPGRTCWDLSPIWKGSKAWPASSLHHMKVEWDDQVLEEDFAFWDGDQHKERGGFKGLVVGPWPNDSLFEVSFIRMPRTPVDLSNIVSYMFPEEGAMNTCTSLDRVHPHDLGMGALTGYWTEKYGGTRTEVDIGNLRNGYGYSLKINKMSKCVEIRCRVVYNDKL